MKTFNYFLIGIIWLFWNIQKDECYIVNSIARLNSLAQSEREMKDAFEHFIRDSEKEVNNKNIGIFGRYIEQLQKPDLCTNDVGFMENPVNAFHFIWKMQMVWKDIVSNLYGKKCKEDKALLDFRNRVQNITGGRNLTDSEDLRYSALGIVRLWQTYNLNLSALLSGTILDEVSHPFTVEQAISICDQLENDRYFYKAIKWIRGLQEEMTKYPHAYCQNDMTTVAIRLASLYSKAGKPWLSVRVIKTEMANKNVSEVALKKLKTVLVNYSEEAKKVSASKRNDTLTPDKRDLELSHYEALCRGDIPRGEEIRSQLRCIHRPTKIPYYRVKEEILNFNPRLSLFYDVITEAQIQAVKERATKGLRGSTLHGGRTSDTRISRTAWYGDHDEEVFGQLAKKVELVTGLNAKTSLPMSAEYMQVVNYGIGGMYTPHHDFLRYPYDKHTKVPHQMPQAQHSGDREATFLFYLSDVKAGGATAFIDMEITVPVTKGAAAFWYNFKRNGELDQQTQHAGCPVLLGSKWVANKWILQGGQMLRRPCGLQPDSIDTPLHS